MIQIPVSPSTGRIRVVDVICRKVALDAGVPKEVEKPESVIIRPLPFRRWPAVINHLANLIKFLPAGGMDIQNANDIQLGLWITTLLGNCGDDLFAVLELATDRPAEFFDMVDGDDALRIIFAVIDTNRDYFQKNLLPLIGHYLPAASFAEGSSAAIGQIQ